MIDRKNIKNLYALSPLQEGMLFHALKEPDSRAYFEQLEFGLEGALDAAAFAAAWQDVVDRHDALRTLFVVKQVPQPLQIVLKQWPITLETFDLTSLIAAQAQARIAAHKAADLRRGFAVTRTPPLRLALFRLAPDRHRVLWSFHHILLDGWSLAILQRDWETCYLARLQDQIAHLPPAPSYAAYIRWLSRQNPGQAAAYWSGLLAEVTEPAPLPPRLERRFATDDLPYVGGEHCHLFNTDIEAALHALARQQGVTLNTVVQTLWGMLLARLNGSHDAVFAATVAGRPVELPDAAQTVGLFINAIPIRVRFGDGLSFADLLDRVHRQAIAGQEFHHAPLAEILAAHPLRQTLAEHILVFENYPLATERPEDPRLPWVAGDQTLHEHTHYAFECQFLPGTPSVLRFRYHRGLFADQAISVLGGQFEALARRALAEPGAPAAALAHAGSPWTPPGRIVAAASFTAEPAIAAANDWLRQMAVPRRVELAPYNQCLRELVDPDSLLNRADLGILLLRWTDALRDLAGSDLDDTDRRLAERFKATVEAVCQRPSATPLLVALLPTASAPDDWEIRWRQALTSRPGVTVFDLTHLATRYQLYDLLDAQADRLGHLPYSESGFAALGAEVARAIVARARPPFKVIAVDCDNTLWSGVCGEAGPTGVIIGPNHVALQQFLIARQEEGFLIALASKNLPDDVWAVFDQHPEMQLHRQHLAAAAINWQPKSANLRTLATELQVGLDSFIFLDDNPAECAEVMTHAPDVLALTVPRNLQQIQEWLSLVWAFDQPAVTAEDRDRTKMMQAERHRQAAQGTRADIEDFLRGLELVVRFGPMQLHQAGRIAQLSQRTNQFNLSGRRRDEAAMIRLAREASVWAVEVEDRFGTYGITGAVIARQKSETLCIDSFLLSCRVLGRRVEDTLLCALARQAARLGCRRIVAPLVPTPRNEPIRHFLRTPPWREEEPDQFVCSVNQVAEAIAGVRLLDAVQFSPPPTVVPDRTHELIPLATVENSGKHSSILLPMTQTIEHETVLRHGVQYLPLLAAAVGWPISSRRLTAQASVFKSASRPLTGETEQRIAAIWSEVLGLAVMDSATPFSELGGHSLHAVRIISRLERTFGREIGLSRLFEQPTIAAMARWLQDTSAFPRSGSAIPPAPDAADYPLSHSQERIWLLCHLGSVTTAYNQCAAYRLRGPLDATALQAAAQQLLNRHEILRTVFSMGANGPRQRILACQTVDFQVEETAGVALDSLCERLAVMGRRPFDLASGPPLRLTLCRYADDDHVLAIFLHHIVGDGWSFGLILHELAAAYRGEALGSASLRYRDYAVWTRSAEFEAHLERHREYWRNRLSDAQGRLPETARIPVDFAERDSPTGQGAGLRRLIATDLSELECELARLQASLFPFLAAAVAVLIARLGGLPTVRLGAPVAGRDRPELEDMVGVCVNTLVLNGQIDEAHSFTTLIKAQQEILIGALEHQHYPFDRLVADLDPPRDPSRHPLFDVLVTLQNTPQRDAELPSVTATSLPILLGVAAFDLVFEFAATDVGLVGELTYATDRYRPETAHLLLERLVTLIAAVRANPDAPLREISLISANEQAQLIAFACGPVRPIPDTTIHGLFAVQAARTPGALALLTASDDFDYKTLDRRTNALAERLIQNYSVRPGEVVAVLLERTVDWPIALLSILKAGGIYLPMEPSHPPARWRQLLADAQPRALIASAKLFAMLGNPVGWSGAWLEPTSIPLVDDAPEVAVGLDDPAYLLYTSGSTGVPKGVLVSHRAFVNMILSQIQAFEITPADRVLQLASCAFDAALSELFLAWLSGAAAALADGTAVRDSAALAYFLSDRQVTVATFTPSYLRQLHDSDLRPLQRVILAGEAVRGMDVGRLHRLRIVCYNAYGPTETAVCATLGRVEDDLPGTAPVPIGRPLANLTVKVLDPHQCPVPIGVAGELVVSGVGVALGYWRRPELTAERFQFDSTDSSATAAFGGLPARSYRTGDRVRWLPNGFLEYLGRSDDQIKRRGQRIELGEVEACIAALDGVRQAAVIGETRQGENLLIAYVCADSRHEASLRVALAEQLPASLLPDIWFFLDQLPLTPNGKLDKNRLPRSSTVDSSTRSAPADAVEAALLTIWRELLGCSPGVDDNFFTIGGNSLNAMRGARLITERLALPCQVLQFFQTPTVRGLADALTYSANRTSTLCATLHLLSPPAIQTLIALPPAPGLGHVYAPLSQHLPRWSLQAFDFADLPVDELIERYARVLVESTTLESFVLLGYSGGGRLALALANALIARQHPPQSVILVDCWRWSTVDSKKVQDAGNLFAMEGLGALATLYCQRLENWKASNMVVNVPVHHLLSETPHSPPLGFSRDWRAICTDSYTEYPAVGAHYDFLEPKHLRANALLLRSVL